MKIKLISLDSQNCDRLNSENSELPLLLYLPGMDGLGDLLQTQVKYLQSLFEIRGLSIPINDLSDWDVLTKTAIETIEAELRGKNQRKIYLCGESFGGCLAIKIAVTAPWLIEKLILVNPASSFNQQPLLGWGINLTSLIPDWLYSSSTFALLPFLAELSRLETSDRQDLLNAMQSLPQQVVSWRLSLLQNFTVGEHQLRSFQKPTLVIASRRDRLLPSVAEAINLVKLFPNSTMEVLPYSGHACLLEKATNLAQIMIKNNLIENGK